LTPNSYNSRSCFDPSGAPAILQINNFNLVFRKPIQFLCARFTYLVMKVLFVFVSLEQTQGDWEV